MKYLRIAVIVLFIAGLGLYGAARIREQQRRDPDQPVLTSDREVLEIPCDYQESQLLEGMTATDGTDGDLTEQIILGGLSKFVAEGECSASYVVFDSSNQAAKLTRRVRFTDYQPPEFTLSGPLVFQEGDSGSAVDRVGASDMLDGDISDMVKLLESSVDYQKAGDYQIRVEVSNSFGDVQEASLPVHIVEKSGDQLTIQLTQNLIYLRQGEEFSPYSCLSGLTDSSGNPLDLSLVQAESSVDTGNAGRYEVHYQANDGAGAYGETWLTVIVRQ